MTFPVYCPISRERGQKLNLIEIEIMQPSSDRTRAGLGGWWMRTTN